jgi:CheY-like chemotaxis protein
MLNKVLVIDDSQEMVDMLKEYLSLYGLMEDQIFISKDPIEALEIFRLNKRHISLVICDYYMPKSNGAELCDILKSNQPNLKIILTTGDSNIKLENFQNIDYVLHKPFDYNVFVKAIEGQIFSKPKYEVQRSNDREVPEKYQVAVLCLKNHSESISGFLFSEGKGGCGIIVHSTKGIKVGDDLEILLGNFDYKKLNHVFEEPRKVEIAWIELINLDTFKVGIKYL